MRDPAIVDRETTYLGPLDPSALRSRKMHITGTDGRLDAKILSKSAGGAATRLVTIPARWGTDNPGVFDADVELFVISGSLRMGDDEVPPHSLVVAGDGQRVPSLRSDDGATALLCTSAPVRFELAVAAGPPAVVISAADRPWVVDDEGVAVKTYDTQSAVTTRLVFAGHIATPSWKRLDSWSERVVIAGAWREHTVNDADGTAVFPTRPLAYVSRPAGTRFDGPRGGTAVTAVFLDRVEGPWQPLPWEKPTP